MYVAVASTSTIYQYWQLLQTSKCTVRPDYSACLLIHITKDTRLKTDPFLVQSQLHATTRHESILRRLAGPPIRPRPRSKFKAKTRWTLVKKKVDDLGSPSAGRKDGNDKGGQGGGRHGRKRSDELQVRAFPNHHTPPP